MVKPGKSGSITSIFQFWLAYAVERNVGVNGIYALRTSLRVPVSYTRLKDGFCGVLDYRRPSCPVPWERNERVPLLDPIIPNSWRRKWPGLTADNRLPLLEGTLHAGFTVNHHLFAVSINLLNT